METLIVTVLGIVQGATEFLPVSSSGHLAVGQLLFAEFGAHVPQVAEPLVLEIILHLATFLAVLLFFRRDVWAALRGAGAGLAGIFRGRFSRTVRQNEETRLAFAVLIATVPTGIIGILLRDAAVTVAGEPLGLGLALIGTACLLLASRWWLGGRRVLSLPIALVIGCVQGIAVLPGISRSGITIATGLALGLGREESARFSFLLSLPAILGAALVELDLNTLRSAPALAPYLCGGLAAFCVGLASLYLLVRLVKQGRFWLFAPYVGTVGILTIIFL